MAVSETRGLGQGEVVYEESSVRLFTIATVFWGLVGVVSAFQLAFPILNLDLPWTSFGRLRPVHTSAVVFAFGGNALLGTSLYVVQRTCRARPRRLPDHHPAFQTTFWHNRLIPSSRHRPSPAIHAAID